MRNRHGLLYFGLVIVLVLLRAPTLLVLAVVFLYMAWLGLRRSDGMASVSLSVDAALPDAERMAAIDDRFAALSEAGDFNGGVLIARAGEPVLMQTYGSADLKGERALTTATPFRLASVSKQFTAAAVLTLVRDERLGLDDEAVGLLPDLPYPGVTVRHLLNQTSGIPDRYMQLAKKHRRALGGRLRIADVPSLLAKAQYRNHRTPGSRYAYSNTDYVLAAGVVEAVSGSTFEAYLKSALFDPLGMTHARVWTQESKDDFPERALDFLQYGSKDSLPLEPEWFDGVAGDGGVFASLEDLLVWERFWREPELVPAELAELCFRAPTLANGEPSDYGFGWAGVPDQPWHNGAWLGARTFVARDLTNDGWLAVLDNSMNANAEVLALELLGHVRALA
ncbi:MAG: serine hydrolase domain-containing protein [Planctomycetota bacterium]